MPRSSRRDQLAAAHQATRELRNRIHALEQATSPALAEAAEWRHRAERALAKVAGLERQVAAYRDLVRAANKLLAELLASGKETL
jgi:chromosome segregation ATPase